MKTHQLSFAKIIIIKDNLAEVIVDDGVLIDLKKVGEYHEFLLTHLRAPFSLLVNKKHSYTYTFKAQTEIASLNQIKAMAVVVEGFNAKKSTDFLISMNNMSRVWNIQTFMLREEALVWLEKQE
ncbi:hypothetical protein [Winogradskyella ludwigii]|jgi:hypothetical protein|uniref:hypothetical protein n=1 Tax=Winogradskyella ludwigii TaxID=2686076 RepID=UPI0015CA2E99|nr:hypothetical protein [Winogradskyella ludwigii]